MKIYLFVYVALIGTGGIDCCLETSHFFKLPIELHHEIKNIFPIEKQLTLRLVNKHFKRLVDGNEVQNITIEKFKDLIICKNILEQEFIKGEESNKKPIENRFCKVIRESYHWIDPGLRLNNTNFQSLIDKFIKIQKPHFSIEKLIQI